MTDEISETVSTNRRRGRPRVFDAATFARLRAEMRQDYADISDRTVQNRLPVYRPRAPRGPGLGPMAHRPEGYHAGQAARLSENDYAGARPPRMLTFWLKWPGSSASGSRPPRTPCG